MSEITFVTSYDNDCVEFAETLMTLVSADKYLCNIKRSNEEFKKDRSIVSGEYILTIGNEASKYNMQNFKDIYNNYGIHFGYHGTKAWISCESFKWDEKSLLKFHTELISVLDELGMNTENIDDIAKKVLKEQKNIKKNIDSFEGKPGLQKGDFAEAFYNEAYNVLMTSLAVNNIMQKNMIMGFFLAVGKWFRDFLKKSERRKQQYKYATVLFYYRYIHDFLELDDKNNKDDKVKMNF